MDTLYISDLDGTLLTNGAELPKFSRTTLQQYLLEGLDFSVASARSVISMRPMLDGLNLSLPVVEFNGAFLSDLATGQHELINALDPAVAEEVYQLVLQLGCTPFMSTYNGRYDCLYYSDMDVAFTNRRMEFSGD